MTQAYDKKLTDKLFSAIENNDMDAARELLAEHPEKIDFSAEKDGGSLLTSIICRTVNLGKPSFKETCNVLDAMIAAGADINHVDKDGAFPLHLAAKNPKLVAHLLELRADPKKRSKNHIPLAEAIFTEAFKSCELLLAAGVDPYEEVKKGKDAFAFAKDNYVGERFNKIVAKVKKQKKKNILEIPEKKAVGDISLANASNLALLDAILKKRRTGTSTVTLSEVKTVPLVEEAKAPVEKDGWVLLAPDRVAHETVETALNLKITEIFNFATKQQTVVTTDLARNIQSNSQRDFDQIGNKEMLDRAQAALARLGPDKKETMHGPAV